MKKTIALITLMLFAVLSLSAAKVSFTFDKAFGGDEKILVTDPFGTVMSSSAGEALMMNLADGSVITVTDSEGGSFPVTVVFTEDETIPATFTWSIDTVKSMRLRCSINGGPASSVKTTEVRKTYRKVPVNTLTVFTLEAKIGKGKWYECGKLGILPVTPIVEKGQEAPEVSAPVGELKGETRIRSVEPTLTVKNQRHYYDRKFILSGYYFGGMILTEGSGVNYMGAKASVSVPVTHNISIVADGEYMIGSVRESVVTGKLRLTSPIIESGVVFVEAGGGADIYLAGKDSLYYPAFTGGLGMELYFTKNVGLSLLADYSMIFMEGVRQHRIGGSAGVSIAFGRDI